MKSCFLAPSPSWERGLGVRSRNGETRRERRLTGRFGPPSAVTGGGGRTEPGGHLGDRGRGSDRTGGAPRGPGEGAGQDRGGTSATGGGGRTGPGGHLGDRGRGPEGSGGCVRRPGRVRRRCQREIGGTIDECEGLRSVGCWRRFIVALSLRRDSWGPRTRALRPWIRESPSTRAPCRRVCGNRIAMTTSPAPTMSA